VKLEEVTITAAGSQESVEEKVVGKEVMSIESIKNLPAFMGEVDPVKSLVTLPGISSVGEGTSGYNVRGGDPGQNLLLQDKAILYNSSHLFGFFSAFNPDLIRDVELLKGGGPANYGGRVASTLNVNLRNGNAKKYQAKGGIGLVSSRLMFEGPIKKDKTSFIIGGRASYSDWLLKALKNPELYQSSASFYDGNFKLNHIHNKNNKFELSAYISNDKFTFASDTTFSWKTHSVTAGWSHIFSEKLLMQTNLVYSNFESDIYNEEPVNAFDYYSGVRNFNGNIDFSWSPDASNTFDFGINSVMYDLNLGEFYPGESNTNEDLTELPHEKGLETALYANFVHDFSPRFSVNAGLRFTNYTLFDGQFYSFDETGNATDTITSPDKMYYGVEPRVSFRYLVSPSASFKASYYRTRQYVHLISNTTAVSPVDYWKSSSYNLKPSNADQYTLGFFKNFQDNRFEFSVEAYYKDIQNVIDYRDGATILLNETLESDLLQGTGRAYGVELLLRKNRGKLTGWIGYTYSRTERKFDQQSEGGETINNGEFFPSNYDKPHDLTFVMNYKASRRIVLNMNFSYSTGRPITTPVSKFQYGNLLSVLNFSDRNQFRVPDYHRLDLSVTLKGNLRKEKKINGEWVFSLYNVYGRKNPYSIYFNQEGSAFQLTILGSAFPSLTYNFTIN
jgi:outer membrane receptor protein involved in Fe transport